MILTITCKNIISEDLNEFKEQISTYNFTGAEISDIMYSMTQNILLEIYGNSQIRYETAENFLNALSFKFFDKAPIYEKKFNILAETIDLENENFIAEVKNFNESKNNTIISNQNEYKKNAETPTTIKASTDFIDKYTSDASKTDTNGRSEERGKIDHSEVNTNNIIDKIEKLNNFRSMLYDNYSKEFNDLFIQFL